MGSIVRPGHRGARLADLSAVRCGEQLVERRGPLTAASRPGAAVAEDGTDDRLPFGRDDDRALPRRVEVAGIGIPVCFGELKPQAVVMTVVPSEQQPGVAREDRLGLAPRTDQVGARGLLGQHLAGGHRRIGHGVVHPDIRAEEQAAEKEAESGLALLLHEVSIHARQHVVFEEQRIRPNITCWIGAARAPVGRRPEDRPLERQRRLGVRRTGVATPGLLQ